MKRKPNLALESRSAETAARQQEKDGIRIPDLLRAALPVLVKESGPQNLQSAIKLERCAAAIRAIAKMKNRGMPLPGGLVSEAAAERKRNAYKFDVCLGEDGFRILKRIARKCFSSKVEPHGAALWILLLGLLNYERTCNTLHAWGKWRDAEGFDERDSLDIICNQLAGCIRFPNEAQD